MKNDTSNDFEKKKKYNRSVYKCEKDDIWVTVETPKK